MALTYTTYTLKDGTLIQVNENQICYKIDNIDYTSLVFSNGQILYVKNNQWKKMKNLQKHISEQREMLIESKSDELAQMITEGQEINEGFFSSLLGGLAGVTIGATVMKAVCKAIGLEKGMIYDLLTSKLVCGIAGAAIANNLGKK